MDNFMWIGLIGGILALVFAYMQRGKVMACSEGSEKMQKIYDSITAKLNSLNEKRLWVASLLEYLQTEPMKQSLGKLKANLIKILLHILPQKGKIDLKLAEMILSGGEGLFRSELVKQEMFRNYLPSAARNRSFGWDMTRRLMIGKFSDQSIWHSGSSGQSMWIDPEKQRYCIVLSNLFGEHDAGIAARLDIANLVAEEIWES